MKTALFAALVLSMFAVPMAHAQVDARMLRYPDVSDTHVTFVYAGDVWLVAKEGGLASRLSSPLGEESFPRFSPDGSSIAFSGNYDGNTDVYVIPALGGAPERLTYHPESDRLVDWHPDGESVLFASRRESGSRRFNQFYRVGVEGGLPAKLPLAHAEFGSFNQDGTTLAFQFLSRDFRTWKRYRGGTAPDIWLIDLNTLEASNLTDNLANDTQAMWSGSKLYFLSDRDANMRFNVWVHDTTAGTAEQVTFFEDFDVHFPAIGPQEIVFEAGGALYLLDLDSHEYQPVEVQVVTDQLSLKPRPEKVGDSIQSMDVSPSGKRAVFEARGEVFTVPAEHGVIRNLTRSSGSAERYPSWSPDGEQIAFWSDRSGEYQLMVRAADGSGEETAYTSSTPGFRYRPQWSPDSKKIVFLDETQTIRLLDLASKEISDIGQVSWLAHDDLHWYRVSWSPDSRWVAFTVYTENLQTGIALYDTASGESHQVTSGYYKDSDPVFDPDGKYLYFLTSRTFDPAYSDVDTSWIYANSVNIAAVPLREDIPYALAPRSDEESADDEEEAEENGDDKKKSRKKKDEGEEESKDPDPVEIDLDGFEQRVEILPPPAGGYGELQAASGKVIYHRHPRAGAPEGAPAPVVYWDLEEREEKTVVEDAYTYLVAAGGEKVLVQKDDTYAIVDLAADQNMEELLRAAEMEMTVVPREEWQQIFNDVWRIMRDFFYDPNMHGVDWDAMREHYGPLVDDAVTRWDVNFVLGELIAELSASHSYRGGGDQEQAARRGVGLLGADFALVDGHYSFARIVDGGTQDSEVRSPLARAGIKEGEFLLAVNGHPVDISRDPWAALQGLGDTLVELTVNDKPAVEGSRQVLVETLSSESRLRNLAWIESNRRQVEEASAGRVGYVYVPDTSVGGQNELFRQFMAQHHKDGLIIDERFNSGGQYPDRFVELMDRRRSGYIGFRSSRPIQYNPVSRTGPQVMLINAWAGSGGDLFPYLFKDAGLGPLIGTRTWGGLIGISGSPTLLDGGYVTAPELALYGKDGDWLIEGHGVEPDIEVIDDPGLLARGQDPQLEAAIEEVQRLIEAEPPVFIPLPAYDDRTAKGKADAQD